MIRYDHRDTGRSVTYEPGRPGYTGGDLVADAVGVLDAYGIPGAHIVGVSAGGAFAQILALDFPERVLSLLLISTSPALPGERALPPPAGELGHFGTADPMFPIGHGEALAEEIPGARLLRFKDAGHGVERPDWETIIRAILDHTAAA